MSSTSRSPKKEGSIAAPSLVITQQRATTADGCILPLRSTYCPSRLDQTLPPLLVVPGYGMNSFIFSYHPRNTSMERCLAEAGFEVWAMDLRGQSRGTTSSHAKPPSIKIYAQDDLSAAIEVVLNSSRTSHERLTLVGCSLGGTIAYTHLALNGADRVTSIVTLGAPLRWINVHPLVRSMFVSRRMAAIVRLSRTRQVVRIILPALRRYPPALAIYMNTGTIDLDSIGTMSRTVEDPHPAINHELAAWIKARELVVDGIDVAAALSQIDIPLLVVLGNRDGVVPVNTALSAVGAWGGADVEALHVGDDDNWYSHANLFIANDAPQLVFDPIVAWLKKRHG